MKIKRCAAACLLILSAVPAGAEPIRLTILHTNDIHGWIMARPGKSDPKKLIGGAPALAARVKRARAEGPTLLIDAGDWYQGTPEGTIPRGKALAELFNAMAYDAVEVGNHEYDIGEARLKELVADFRVPVLGANVARAATGERVDYLKPYVIKEVAGVKVGIFGLLTTHMPHLSFAKNIAGLKFPGEVETARRMVAELKAQGATVIIAVTHVGFEAPDRAPFVGDQTVAQSVPGIDLIVGGHTHTFVPDPPRVNGTLIVQAGFYLTHVGRVTLDIDPKTKKVVASSGRLEALNPEDGRDPAAQAIVDRYEREVGRALEVVVATATAALRRDRSNESAMGDWMADCEREWAKTQLAFQNGGGIRSDLEPGPVRLRDIFSVMPFDNSVVTMTMTGRQILEVLKRGVCGQTSMIQLSGLRLRYRPDAPDGACVREALVDGKALDKDGTYSVSAVDFMVQGGDGYTGFSAAANKVSTDVLMRDVLISCAKAHPSISPVPPGRIQKEGP